MGFKETLIMICIFKKYPKGFIEVIPIKELYVANETECQIWIVNKNNWPVQIKQYKK